MFTKRDTHGHRHQSMHVCTHAGTQERMRLHTPLFFHAHRPMLAWISSTCYPHLSPPPPQGSEMPASPTRAPGEPQEVEQDFLSQQGCPQGDKDSLIRSKSKPRRNSRFLPGPSSFNLCVREGCPQNKRGDERGIDSR
jgi:hypothetical protein